MYQKLLTCLLVVGCAGLSGCSGSATTATGGRSDKKDQFTIDGWKLPISLKKGNTTDTDFQISRGKDFNDTVTFKIAESKTGLKFDPAEPTIDNSSKKVNVKIHADDKADIGEHTVTVTGTPSKGGETAKATFTVKVTE